ncbi:MAG: hypothetical protein ABI867_37665 [Kofleriaceae bacterium]
MRVPWIVVAAVSSACVKFEAGEPPIEPHGWATVAIGDHTACGITQEAELYCWGAGLDGLLGIGSTPATSLPARVGDDRDWTAVTVGPTHACGLQNGALACWGSNHRGALGSGPVDAIAVSPLQIDNARWVQVDAGEASTCGIRDDGSLWCWGANDRGQLGNGTIGDVAQPERIGTEHWRSIALGIATTCGIRSDATLWCWGANERGQLGADTIGEPQLVPLQIGAERSWRAVVTGEFHSCAIDGDGGGWCWGLNANGRLGTGGEDSATPARIAAPPTPLDEIAVGRRHSCARAGAEMRCWGSGSRGATANVLASEVSTPARVDIVAHRIAAGGETSCVIDDDDRLLCAGANASGEAGSPAGEVHALAQADDRTDWQAIYAGRGHACARDSNDVLSCWGLGARGQVGDRAFLDQQAPHEVFDGKGFANLAMNSDATAARRGDELWGWGIDVGSGGTFGEPTLASTGITGVALGEGHGCALEIMGRLSCRGENRYGQLGGGQLGNDPPIPDATVIIAGTWRSVHASIVTTCATKTDAGLVDRLFCWGVAGMVGSPTASDTGTPLAVELPAQEVHDVAIGADFACARIGDGELWCWGSNEAGQLGNPTDRFSQIPVRVGTRADWIALAAGDQHACALAADHTLWCWGRGDHGQIGEPLAPRKTPQQLGTRTDWAAVALGDGFTCALAQDGTRWCAGTNGQGELGNGRAWLPQLTLVK